MGGWQQFVENFAKWYDSASREFEARKQAERELKLHDQFAQAEELLLKGIITRRDFRKVVRSLAYYLVEIVRDEAKAKKARPGPG